MEIYAIEHLNFKYPNTEKIALNDVSINIEHGEIVTIFGASGCGKTTLMRQLKPILSPHGEKSGEILFEGSPLKNLSRREMSAKIGYVLQSPENQIVTDKVWHELAFGLESLGVKQSEIRTRVSEMASFFGISDWFHKKVCDLSGGQKQLLNLASIMVMQPKVLILDEPTSQLDPIAASEFLQTIKKINREIGTTIILSEHRLEEAFPMSDRVIAMENGRLIAFGTPEHVGQILKDEKSNMFESLPTPMRVFSAIKSELPCPITVRDGRRWLENIAKVSPPNVKNIPNDVGLENLETPIIELKDVHFRYEKNEKDVVKGLSVKILESEIFAIVGGNGTGKTTSLSIMSGLLKPYRGEVLINGNDIKKLSDSEKFGGLFGVLPQNPQSLFVKNTVKLDLYEMLKNRNLQKEEQDRRFEEVCEICEIWDILESHPYDVSGGEQQRIALAKILLIRPKILFLDEPTTGMDSHFKKKLGRILRTLSETG
ncbi:MAG: energy-coupling factor transporter ATPase, partial [Oscillospiraceae bacterium]